MRQAEHGYRAGIGLALHLPRSRHFFIGVDRSRDLPSSSEELAHLVGRLSLFILHACEVASTVLLPSSDAVGPALTPREEEVLRWTLAGKTAWEVGRILGISGRTAAIHANNATRKLGCANKYQAAVQALHHGYLGDATTS
jgi:DNA-binding CsgD family transcriptional regulator